MVSLDEVDRALGEAPRELRLVGVLLDHSLSVIERQGRNPANHGMVLAGVEHDTLLQSYVLESHKPHDLDSLAWRQLDWKTLTYAEVCGKGVGQSRAQTRTAGDDDVNLETSNSTWTAAYYSVGVLGCGGVHGKEGREDREAGRQATGMRQHFEPAALGGRMQSHGNNLRRLALEFTRRRRQGRNTTASFF